MEVSSYSNSFQNLQQFQKKVDTAPNPVSKQESNLTLTPQGENLAANKQELNTTSVATEADAQAQQDARRENGVDYIERQSKKSQVEIYLAVATDNKVEFGGDKTPSIIESLRDVQKQNNAVDAYATYQENQKSAELF